MPDWSNWVTFILGTLIALITIGGTWLAWRRRTQPLRLGLSIQPYALAGHRIGNGPTAPAQLLQLDITNVSNHPVVVTGARMRLRGEAGTRPVFNEGTGEGWIINKPIAPGAVAFVKCSGRNEPVLRRMTRITVHANGQRPVHLGRFAVRRATRALERARKY